MQELSVLGRDRTQLGGDVARTVREVRMVRIDDFFGDDPALRQQRRDAMDHVPRTGDHQLPTGVLNRNDVGEIGEDFVLDRNRRAEAQPLLRRSRRIHGRTAQHRVRQA